MESGSIFFVQNFLIQIHDSIVLLEQYESRNMSVADILWHSFWFEPRQVNSLVFETSQLMLAGKYHLSHVANCS